MRSKQVRGSSGIWMVNGPPNPGQQHDFAREPSGRCKVMVFSKDGSRLAWCNGDCVKVYDTVKNEFIQEFPRPKASCMTFSPRASLLVTWEPYTVDKETQAGVANLHIYNVASGQCVKSLIQKKVTYWSPSFSDDEKICCRNVNNELHFFENGNFDEIKTKLHLQKVAGYSLSGAGPPYMVAGYVPGAKGQPSFVRVFKYPNFGGNNAAIANRTFFKADKVEMQWNNNGSAMLLLTTTDTSESSYYGDQGLHYLGVNGESSLVHLGKNGPVYHVEWSPKSTEFCVVYGFMPAKVTIYNQKTEPVFDFGTGPRNFSFYNPQGNILALCGFGNLRGNMEFWDVKQKKLICQATSPDTTSFQWCADGEHVLTATCAPRLRVGNGFRIWHYSGAMLHEELTGKGEELWEGFWCPAPTGRFPEKPISYRQVQSEVAAPAPPPGAQKTYVPPSMRGREGTMPSTKLHEYELPSNMKQQATDPNKPMSKNKKKKEAKKNRDADKGGANEQAPAPMATAAPSNPAAPSTGDPEKDKKIRNLRKKLQQVEKLKEQQAAGKTLEKNQLEKLKTEDSLLEEIEALEIS
ncbi:eukaryotic translation initiation factor 2A-like isoform X2 [Mya arenaria]|uniref:eukaryotic translation initiation factor 2A-like isoform X2 n=1 Tax=Mya arenaria TaxID=6604 RepID=UPI0022E48DE3|nr:eukaryotic translation initiation factor 2A-like isoform X2 [Mya arenaria]